MKEIKTISKTGKGRESYFRRLGRRDIGIKVRRKGEKDTREEEGKDGRRKDSTETRIN